MNNLILDNQSFKALSSETRINILKELNKRQMTLSELSKKLNLKNSTIKEHCEILIKTNLIEQKEEGRKWKYYSLTKNGLKIISPNPLDELKILIMICLGIVLIGGLISMINFNELQIAKNSEIDQIQTASIMKEEMRIETFSYQNQIESNENENKTLLDNNILTNVLILIIGIIFGWSIRKKLIKKGYF
jgi:DNA-binding transcriptional ArsR family regulator